MIKELKNEDIHDFLAVMYVVLDDIEKTPERSMNIFQQRALRFCKNYLKTNQE